MKFKNHIGRIIYFAFIAPTLLQNALETFNPESSLYKFYHIMMAFNKHCSIFYALQVANAVLTLAALLSFFLFISRIRWLEPKIWQWIFIAKIASDLTSHLYEWNFIRSLFYSNTPLAVLCIAATAALLLPFYSGCFQYAFRQERLFPPKS